MNEAAEAPVVDGAGYYTAEQLAAYLQVDASTIYRMASREASMPTLRLGGVVRFPRERVLQWLAEHEQGQARPRSRKVAAVA